jgi:hypothetical protein
MNRKGFLSLVCFGMNHCVARAARPCEFAAMGEPPMPHFFPKRTRAGFFTVDCLGAFVGLTLAGSLVIAIVLSQGRLKRLERQAAELEQAQNLVENIRRGDHHVPSAWTLTRTKISDALDQATLVGPQGTKLVVLLPGVAP